MTIPIRPSLAQLLATPATTQSRPPQVPAPKQVPAPTQKSILAQILAGQSVTPATYRAEDIARATAQAPADNETKPILRPGSYLNIQV
jgi:hypothetical protein